MNEADQLTQLTDDVSVLSDRVNQLELELASMRAQMKLLLATVTDPSTAAVNNGAVSATDDSTNTATINQSDETTGDGDGDGDKETTASVMDTTTTAVNNVVVSTNVSTNTTTTNQTDQTDETTIKEE